MTWLIVVAVLSVYAVVAGFVARVAVPSVAASRRYDRELRCWLPLTHRSEGYHENRCWHRTYHRDGEFLERKGLVRRAALVGAFWPVAAPLKLAGSLMENAVEAADPQVAKRQANRIKELEKELGL